MVDLMTDAGSEDSFLVPELTGLGAPPMANGELLFEQPWQSSAFGMARALCEAGVFTWDDFRQLLIVNIQRWEQDSGTQTYAYYDIFLQTLTLLLVKKGLCPQAELDNRQHQLAERPHGHDH